jgi:hypothetical protein
MNNAYMSAIAALAGSAVGALASFLCASADVIVKAVEAMRLIFENYHRPNIDFRNIEDRQERDTMCFGRLAKLAVKTCAFRCGRVVKFHYRASLRRNLPWR